MKKGIEEFREDLLGGEIEFDFENVTSIDDVYNMALKSGYDFSFDELESSEISDDILACVAGGKGNKTENKSHLFMDKDVHDVTFRLN